MRLLVRWVGGVLALALSGSALAGTLAPERSHQGVDLAASRASALVSFSAMLPGDQVTSPITVTNSGADDVRYAVTSTTTENLLAGRLAMTIKTGVASCTNAGFRAGGTVVYGPGPLGNTRSTKLTHGLLRAGARKVLCVNVSLPISAGNAFQNRSNIATLTFGAAPMRASS